MATLQAHLFPVIDHLTRPGAEDTDHAAGMLLRQCIAVLDQNMRNGLPSGILPLRMRYLADQVRAKM